MEEMNNIMEKLKKINEETTRDLIRDFIFTIIATIVISFGVAYIFFRCCTQVTPTMTKVLNMVTIFLCVGIVYGLVTHFIAVIESELRRYKNAVEVAIHHVKEEKDFKDELKESNHIPRID